VAGKFIGIYHWSTRASLTDPAFYQDMLTRLWALHLTPAGFALILFALLATWHWPRRHVLDAWFGVFVLFLFVTIEGNRHHEFHQLPLLPPAALFFGLVAAPAFDGEWLRRVGGRVAGAAGSAVTLVAIALLSFKFSGVVDGFFRPDRLDKIPIAAGASIQRVVDPAALLVTVEYEEYGNNSAILLYWAHRRGWSFDKTSITPEVIELLRKDFGARYFVTTIAPVLEGTRPDVFNYLKTKRRVQLPDAPRDTVLYDLTEPAGGS